MKIQLYTWFFMGVAVAFPSGAIAQPALKDVFKQNFLVGVALNRAQVSETNSVEVKLIEKHFNAISPENLLKWEWVHPEPGRYDFRDADRYVEFGLKHGMFIVGHTLVWHSQTPYWVFKDSKGNLLTREALLERMSNHIHTVVGRYKGKVNGWDVVNEALDNDGTLRQSLWMKIIGEDYIQKAFEFAHEADPGAELYYNDYALEDLPKRDGAIKLVKKLQAAGVKLTGIGIQGHYFLDRPKPSEIEDTIETFGKLGLKVMITELDVNVLPNPTHSLFAEISTNFAADPKWNPYTNGLPSELEERLADRYEELFRVFTRDQRWLSRVTFWGVTDGNSWLNDWPIHGRTNYPLLFDRAGNTKPAFRVVVQMRQTNPGSQNGNSN